MAYVIGTWIGTGICFAFHRSVITALACEALVLSGYIIFGISR